jgi:FxLD family lantipeptide
MSDTGSRTALGDFDLDITTVQALPRAADLLNSTSDGCGGTTDSAGVTCFV